MNFENHTHFPAAWTLGFEPDGRELLVIAVKATFGFPENGRAPRLSEQQVPLVEEDEFTGEAGHSATIHETDFAQKKPYCDVILNGSAYAPDGKPSKRVPVMIQVGDMKKAFNVIGDRRWDRIMMQDTPTLPMPFVRKTISYDVAYGGADANPHDENQTSTYELNPIGMGYYPHSTGKHLEGKPLPNTEESGKPVNSSKTGSFRPMSFGHLGRNFSQRARYAGTYDQSWLENRSPLWPADFDYLYFQSSPPEQCIAYPNGGEPVILNNLTPEGIMAFALPDLSIPILMIPFRNRAMEVAAKVDTIVIEPDMRRFTLTARVSYPLKRNCFEFREVIVGATMRYWRRRRSAAGKPYYRSISDFIDSRKADQP